MANKSDAQKTRRSKSKSENTTKKKSWFSKFRSFMNNGPMWKRLVKWFLFVLLLMAIFGGVMVGALMVKYKRGLSPVNDNTFYTAKASTNVYDRNKEFVGSLSRNNIRWTDLYDINHKPLVSEQYLAGLIATEDKNFTKHHGVDYPGMAKAAVSTVFSDNDRGGSSITMQLAKIVYMQDWITPNEEGIDKRSQDKIGYKITQMLYAQEIEKHFDKQQILENYVNVVGFGNAGYGIVNAANYFYDKAPNELDLNESATLAGMSQLPGVYDPYANPEGTTERRNIVLERMLKEKFITQEEYDQVISTPINATLVDPANRPVSNFEKLQGYLDVVYREFLDLVDPDNNGQFDVNTAGMDIYTNMDTNLQIGVYDIINSENANYFEDDVIQTGVVLMDSNNGEVLAIGNGRDEHQGFFGTNYAYNYNRQPGSTAKPIVDAGPAIEYLDWSSAHPLEDKPTSYDGGPAVHNADGQYLGWVSLRESLGKSRNTTALETFKQVSQAKGINSIYNFVTGLGFDQIKKDDFNQAYAIGGWQYGTTPYQLAGAYAAFGNGGTYNTPHTINKILIKPESISYEKYGAELSPKVESRRVMKESTSFIMSEMLKANQPDAAGYAPYAPAIPSLSVKTGTSDWGDAGKQYGIPVAAQRDKWVAGFNNDITLVTWTGYTQEYEKTGHFIGFNTSYDKNAYKALVTMIANNAPQGLLGNGNLAQPDNVEAKKASINNGKIVDNPNGSTYYFIKDSDDAKGLSENTKANTPSNFTINVDSAAQSLNLSWGYDNKPDNVSFIITIDGKEFARTNDLSYRMSYNDIVKAAGCKSSYVVNVIAVSKDKNGKENQSPPTGEQTIDFKTDQFCKTPSQ